MRTGEIQTNQYQQYGLSDGLDNRSESRFQQQYPAPGPTAWPNIQFSTPYGAPLRGPSPEEIRNQVLVELFKSYSLEMLQMPMPNATAAIKALDTALEVGNGAYYISQALERDLNGCDRTLSGTLAETRYQLTQALGPKLAAFLLKQLIQKHPPAAVIATILGPQVFNAIINDIPLIIDRVVDVTGLHIENGRLRFDWKTYNPYDDPKFEYIEWQKDAGTRFGKWGNKNLPHFIDFLERLAEKIRAVRDRLLR